MPAQHGKAAADLYKLSCLCRGSPLKWRCTRCSLASQSTGLFSDTIHRTSSIAHRLDEGANEWPLDWLSGSSFHMRICCAPAGLLCWLGCLGMMGSLPGVRTLPLTTFASDARESLTVDYHLSVPFIGARDVQIEQGLCQAPAWSNL